MRGKEVEVVKYLLTHKEQNTNVRIISNGLKMDYKLTYGIIGRLEKAGIISVEKFGHSNNIKLINKISPIIFEAEYQRRLELFKNKDFLVIHNHLSELKLPFIALLFGSYAKGKQDKHSDIDILVVGGEEKEIGSALSILPDRIHLTHITYKDFLSMAKSKEFTVVSEAIKNNVILVGIEEYYRLLENAG